jgi:hypothetical protein
MHPERDPEQENTYHFSEKEPEDSEQTLLNFLIGIFRF